MSPVVLATFYNHVVLYKIVSRYMDSQRQNVCYTTAPTNNRLSTDCPN